MAWARVQGNGSVAASGTTQSVTISAVGSGNAICGAVGWDNGTSATITSVADDKGNTYNLETEVVDTSNGQAFRAFSRSNITNAPVTITATFSVSTSFIKVLVSEFSGGSTASADERDGAAHGGQFQSSPGTGTDAISSGTFTTSTNGDLIYGVTMDASSTAVSTHGTNFTDSTSSTATYNVQDEWRVQTTAAAGTAATFTKTPNSPHVTYMIALKAPTVAGHPTMRRWGGVPGMTPPKEGRTW